MADAEHGQRVAPSQAARADSVAPRATGLQRLHAAFDRHREGAGARELHAALLDAVNCELVVGSHLRTAAAALPAHCRGARRLLLRTAARCEENADNYARFGAVILDEACRG